MKKINFVRSLNRIQQHQIKRWYLHTIFLTFFAVLGILCLQTKQLFELWQAQTLHAELTAKTNPLHACVHKQQTLRKQKEELVHHMHTIKEWKNQKNPGIEITELVNALEKNRAVLTSYFRTQKKCEITVNLTDPTAATAIMHSIKTLPFIKDIQLTSLSHHKNQIEIKLDGSTKES